MNSIDKMRIAAVQKLQELGYQFESGGWAPPANTPSATTTDVEYLLSVLKPFVIAKLKNEHEFPHDLDDLADDDSIENSIGYYINYGVIKQAEEAYGKFHSLTELRDQVAEQYLDVK